MPPGQLEHDACEEEALRSGEVCKTNLRKRGHEVSSPNTWQFSRSRKKATEHERISHRKDRVERIEGADRVILNSIDRDILG